MTWSFACDLASLIDALTWDSMTLAILPSKSMFRIALRMNAAKPTATVIPTNIFICRLIPRRLRRRPFWLDDLLEWDELLERDDLSSPDEDLPGLGLADLVLAEVRCEGWGLDGRRNRWLSRGPSAFA